MTDPLVQYLVGAFIFAVGIIILLSSPEIARGLAHFWGRWMGKNSTANAAPQRQPDDESYRTRLIVWRGLGVLIVADGLIWIVLASAQIFHLLPHNKP